MESDLVFASGAMSGDPVLEKQREILEWIASKVNANIQTDDYLSRFFDREPPMVSGHNPGEVCFGCERCFVPNPKYIGRVPDCKKKT